MPTYSERRAAGSRTLASTTGHSERRRTSRERLLDAARSLFIERDYFSLSVDDIAKAADLSRAGFYLHYPSKEAVLVDIVKEASARLDPLYRWFGQTHNPSRAKIREFLQLATRLTKRSRRQVSLFYQATAYNGEIWKTFAQNRERHVQMLGESIPAFRDARRPAATERARRARALLLLFQIEQLTLYATFTPDEIDVTSTIGELADAFHAFVEEFALPGGKKR
jgi:AcrR family transcriptional regulator